MTHYLVKDSHGRHATVSQGGETSRPKIQSRLTEPTQQSMSALRNLCAKKNLARLPQKGPATSATQARLLESASSPGLAALLLQSQEGTGRTEALL